MRRFFAPMVALLILAATAFALPTRTFGLDSGDRGGSEPANFQAATDLLYLSDSGSTTNGTSALFAVALDLATGRANLTPLANGVIPLNQVDAIAATADGSKIYVIDFFGGFGFYDVQDASWNPLGSVLLNGGVLVGINSAGFSPAGVLYAGDQNTDSLYRIDV